MNNLGPSQPGLRVEGWVALTCQGSERVWQRNRQCRPPGCDVAQMSSSGKSGGPQGQKPGPSPGMGVGFGDQDCRSSSSSLCSVLCNFQSTFPHLIHPATNRGGLVVAVCAKEDRSSERMEDAFHGDLAGKCVSQDQNRSSDDRPSPFPFWPSKKQGRKTIIPSKTTITMATVTTAVTEDTLCAGLIFCI